MMWLRSVAARFLLPIWFSTWSIWYFLVLARSGTWNFDAHIYYRAAAAWLDGGDPWAVGVALETTGRVYHFAGLPPTLFLYAPFTVLPEDAFAIALLVASAVAAIYIVRRLALAWWWLLFPPLVIGVGSANPGVILLALLLLGGPVAEAAAAGLKVYAVVPMLAQRRWRGLVLMAYAGTLSLALFPDTWAQYLSQAGDISTRLVVEADGGVGATAFWWLAPPTVAAVLVIAWLDRKAAGWLAVPALWSSAQFHYSVMALPVIRFLPAALFAVPIYGMPAAAVILHAWLLLWERSRRGTLLPLTEKPGL